MTRKAFPDVAHIISALQTCRDSVPLWLPAGLPFAAPRFILYLIKRGEISRAGAPMKHVLILYGSNMQQLLKGNVVILMGTDSCVL